MNRNTQQQTVAFKNPNPSLSAVSEVCEEVDYVNAAVSTVDKTPAVMDKKPHSLTQSIPTIAVSWMILSVILALDIYFTSVIAENNTKLTEENQELETQRNNLTQQIEKEETEWNELNVTRAQWSIDAYCPIERDKRHCNACQAGWLHNTSSCYAINNPGRDEQKNWREAQENCRGKASDLVVVVDEKEKEYISDHSWDSSGTRGYWIGLRVEDGRWKWVDGSDLTKESWIGRPEKDHCAISVLKDRGWKSVSCSERNRWFCEKAALSV
ncbi:CD209 antigen-like protein A [Seriola aureovittata]|uniref:CD209 antigen-like protein A n=1 Tax=Seriola aureovittata TaxID=2871759 RepID=UPI0024BD6095|nr:CD209 antigen-like protein A [Seriola aureovittata]